MNGYSKVTTGNLFSNLPDKIDKETFETILSSDNLTIERIVSKGHRSPEGYWYDQDKHEWVLVLKGSAELRFENEQEIVKMMPGDYINIPAHRKHRVEWTDPDGSTVWLAVRY
jgi:cupin 2 domain-containing protein